MKSHLIFGGFFYLASLTPWMILNLKLRGRWSAFRVYALWSLIRVTALVPLVWVDFDAYSRLTWPCRAITVGLLIAVAAEMFGMLRYWWGPALGAAIILLNAGEYAPLVYRIVLGFVAFCAAAKLVQPSEYRTLAAGLLIMTLFPAISETPHVLEFGGWLRFVPTLSAWVALIIWIKGISQYSDSVQSFDSGRAFKRRASRAAAGRARQA